MIHESKTQVVLVACAKCGMKRKDFVIGTVDDRCPFCGFKEGCCD